MATTLLSRGTDVPATAQTQTIGSHSGLAPHRARLYCGYDASTAEIVATQNVWNAFPAPSTAITTFRQSPDNAISFSTAGGTISFTYARSTPAWMEVGTVCNVVRASGSGTRDLEFQWRVNGTPVGPVRRTHMNGDAQILTGVGWLFLSDGDVVEPFVRNIENNANIGITNCTFSFLEDIDW